MSRHRDVEILDEPRSAALAWPSICAPAPGVYGPRRDGGSRKIGSRSSATPGSRPCAGFSLSAFITTETNRIPSRSAEAASNNRRHRKPVLMPSTEGSRYRSRLRFGA